MLTELVYELTDNNQKLTDVLHTFVLLEFLVLIH